VEHVSNAIRSCSLKEIQEEEDAVRREAEFISWFEEESRKAQEATGIPVKPVRRGGAGAERGKTQIEVAGVVVAKAALKPKLSQ
jgi:hypothetical protein